jgi:hypothetical protein
MVARRKVAIGSLTCVGKPFEQQRDDVSNACTLQGLSDLSGLREQRVDVVS